MFIMFILGVLSVVIFTLKINGRMEQVKEHYEVFDTGKLSIVVNNDSRLFLPYTRILNKEEEIETRSIRARSRMHTLFKQYFSRRGVYEFTDLNMEVRDIFNIFTLKKIVSPVHVRVYPKIKEIKEDSFDKGFRDDELKSSHSHQEDIYSTRELRKYNPGDGLKRINWKVSAKHGDLYVRIGEENTAIGYLLVIDMNQKIFHRNEEGTKEEMLIAEALGVSKFLVKAGKDHKVVINGLERRVFDIKNERNFEGLIEYMIDHDSLGDKPLYGFLNEKAEIFKSAASIILFTGDLNENTMRELIKIKNNYNFITCYTFEGERNPKMNHEGITIRYLEE
ncbi:MAG: DUF58 domain-containing protein [Clostridiaceae bacterium]